MSDASDVEGLIERLRLEGENAMRKHLSLGMWGLSATAADALSRLAEDCRDAEQAAEAEANERRRSHIRIAELEARVKELEEALEVIAESREQYATHQLRSIARAALQPEDKTS